MDTSILNMCGDMEEVLETGSFLGGIEKKTKYPMYSFMMSIVEEEAKIDVPCLNRGILKQFLSPKQDVDIDLPTSMMVPIRDNFLTNRNQIMQKFQSAKATLFAPEPELIGNADYIGTIHSVFVSYGCYKELQSLYPNDIYTNEIGLMALEQYVQLSITNNNYIACLIRSNQRNKCKDYIMASFLSQFITKTDRKSHTELVRLGYIMIFHCDLIFQFLQNVDCRIVSQILHALSKERINLGFTTEVKTRLINESKTIKPSKVYQEITKTFRTEKDIKQMGIKYLLNKTEENLHLEDVQIINFCQGEYRSKVTREYDISKEQYIMAITSKAIQSMQKMSLIVRVLAMIGLSLNCRKLGEYAIGKKLLYAAKQITDGYFLNYFIKNDYGRYRAKLMKRLKTKKCEYCGTVYLNKRLRCCSHCMKVMYCNKKCQKYHWNQHKTECNGSWKEFYPALKQCIFDRLA
eukprot:317205_1